MIRPFVLVVECHRYPEHPWKAWLFGKAPQGYWEEPKHQKLFLDWFANKWDIKHYEDWYNVKSTDFVQKGGWGFMSGYHHSFTKTLTTIYPEHPWHLWKFSQAPKGFWSIQSNVNTYVGWLSQQLNINTLSDWQSVSVENVRALSGFTLLHSYGGLRKFLAKIYPANSWHQRKNEAMAKSQTQLCELVQSIFPNVEIQVNAKYQDLFCEGVASHSQMELDLYIPSLKLAFEYNGIQHYQWHFTFGTHHQQRARGIL